MAFSDTITHHPEAYPGVTVTLKRMGFSRRTDLAFDTLQIRQRVIELEAEYPAYTDKEKELREQLSIAEKKATVIAFEAPESLDYVLQNDVLPLMREVEAAVPAGAKV